MRTLENVPLETLLGVGAIVTDPERVSEDGNDGGAGTGEKGRGKEEQEQEEEEEEEKRGKRRA